MMADELTAPMTREEAAAIVESYIPLAEAWLELFPESDDPKRDAKALRMAIAALKEQAENEKKNVDKRDTI